MGLGVKPTVKVYNPYSHYYFGAITRSQRDELLDRQLIEWDDGAYIIRADVSLREFGSALTIALERN